MESLMASSKQKKGAKEAAKKDLLTYHRRAAIIDIGANPHFEAVLATHYHEPIRSFGTFTSDLQRLAEWLEQAGMTTITIESTGIYCVPVYEILDSGWNVTEEDASADVSEDIGPDTRDIGPDTQDIDPDTRDIGHDTRDVSPGRSPGCHSRRRPHLQQRLRPDLPDYVRDVGRRRLLRANGWLVASRRRLRGARPVRPSLDAGLNHGNLARRYR